MSDLKINYGRTGRAYVRGIINAEQKLQQQQRRIFMRCGAVVPLFVIRMMGAPDYLESRAMWRRQGRALRIASTCVGGKVERFLAP